MHLLYCGIQQQRVPVKELVSAVVQNRYKKYNRTALESGAAGDHKPWSVIQFIYRSFQNRKVLKTQEANNFRKVLTNQG